MSTVDSTVLHHGFHADPETGVCYRTLDFLDCPGYRVGDDGSVWSCKVAGDTDRRYATWFRLRPETGRSGHQRVLLMPGRKHAPVYHLVLLAFIGPRLTGTVCRHFPDRDTNNNCVENVRWGTHLENQRDRKLHGTARIQKGTANVMAKLDEPLVRRIRADSASGVPGTVLAKQHGVSAATISLIVNRKIWSHVT